MKRSSSLSVVASLALFTSAATPACAQVFINELMANAPGGDSGLEYFELRGPSEFSLTGYFLLSLEGQGNGRGDINQFFDFTGVDIGANGYLIGLQNGSPYPPLLGSTVLQNTTGNGWGQVNGAGSSVGHSSDGAQTDIENSASTILLINIGSGVAPTLSTDLDTNNDGALDLPQGWSVVDSVGLLDGVGALETDISYGAITFRIGGVGGSLSGNVIDLPTTGTSLYVGRKGVSTGSSENDWFGAIPSGSAGNYTFGSATDSFFEGMAMSDMQFGGLNPVPEPSSLTLLLAGVGLVASRFRVRR
jgi:hypothetical protein